MAALYLDTNIIIDANYFRSVPSQVFLKACAFLGIEVVIPETVIDEVYGNFKKDILKANASLKKAQKEVSKLIDVTINIVDVDAAFEEYHGWLEALFKEIGVTILPYPDTLAKTLVVGSYSNVKPFKEGGDGFKDYLIWEAIKAHFLSQKKAGPYIFASSNTSDFGEKNNDNIFQLHTELSEQLSGDNLPLRYFTNRKSVMDEIIAPQLGNMNIPEVAGLMATVDAFIESTLLHEFESLTLFGLEGVSFSNDITIGMVGPHDGIEVKAYQVDDELALEITGFVEIEAEGFMEKSTYYLDHGDFDDVSVNDGNWNNHVMEVSQTVNTPFEFDAVYSLKDKEITGYSFSLPNEVQTDWYN